MIDSRLPCECCLCAFVEGFFEDAADLLCEHLRLTIQPGSQEGRSAMFLVSDPAIHRTTTITCATKAQQEKEMRFALLDNCKMLRDTH